MAKKKSKHQNFKLSQHGQSQERVILYIVLVFLFAIVAGFLLRDNFAQVLGVATY
ncbi:MAG: hypothetical protein HYV38_03010 [Candidatus Levybacteria bacterium]|nr:hypothetical protein [Candidatus Levybacteria bacterium]MBI2421027.1 hypothetical protein [Candidatus Levybacteria bacterium]